MNARELAIAASTTKRGQPRKTDPRRAIAYVRVSTAKQDLGPDAQRDAIKRWADENDVEIVEWFEERVSATQLAKRVELWDAIQLAKDERCGRFIVAKRSRLARDQMVAELIARQLANDRIELVSADEHGNGTSPTEVFVRKVMDAFYELERSLISARTRAALRQKAKRGERYSGAPPYGFEIDPQGSLQPHEQEQRIIGMIATMRSEGMTIRDIATELNRERVAARGARWHPTTISRILDRAKTAT